MTGYSLKEISARLNTGQIPQVTAGKPIYTQEELVGAVGNIMSPLLDMPLKNSLAMKAGVGSATFTRASTATYIDRYGVLKTAAIDEPRFEKEGYLNEGSSTNLLLYSEQFDNASWGAVRLSIGANASETVDPFGTNLAEKVTVDSSLSSSHYVTQSGLSIGGTSGVSVTKSIFAKAGNGTGAGRYISLSTSSYPAWANDGAVFFDLVAGVVSGGSGLLYSSGNYKMEALANGWYRCSIYQIADTGGTTTTTTNINMCNGISDTFDGNGTDYIYVFGAQLEALPFATSYIPTTSAAVTRSADRLSVTAIGNIPKLDNVTVGVDFDSFGYDTASFTPYSRLFEVSTTNDSFGIRASSTGNIYSAHGTSLVYSGFISSINGSPITSKKRFITSANNGLIANAENGMQVVSSTYSNAGAVNSQLYIGADKLGTGGHLYGHISNFRVWDKALTAQEVALA